MRNCAIIIPAYNPTNSLIEYVRNLKDQGAREIIVINDGSEKELNFIFSELDLISGCTVLTHEENRGKGRALKTAFTYFLAHCEKLVGVITADADGQHTVEDVCKISLQLETSHEGIILGVRDFSQSEIPARSLIGNKITSLIFRVLYGHKLSDTQTGLRGIHRRDIPALLELKGERYEYEINMLIYAKKLNIDLKEVYIETIYIDNNASSHYHPVIDSLKIFLKLISGFLSYCFSTITSGIIDILCFILLNSFLLVELSFEVRVFLATFISRTLSSTYNYLMNRRMVFHSQGSRIVPTLIKYYILCLGMICSSYLLVTLSHFIVGANVIFAKIIIDTILGICSYQIQLRWVFKKRKRI